MAWFLLLSFNLFSQTSLREKYMGVHYKDVEEINELKKISSSVINLHYGVTHVKSDDNKQVLFVSKFENSVNLHDDYQLRIVDVIEIPRFNENYYCVSLKGCSDNGKSDPTIFALAKKDYDKYLTTIVKVWKLDKSRGKLIDYPKLGVKCLNQQGFVMND